MKKLIEALQIFSKYKVDADIAAGHDVIMVGGIEEEDVSEEDTKRLEELDFSWDDDGFWSRFV